MKRALLALVLLCACAPSKGVYYKYGSLAEEWEARAQVCEVRLKLVLKQRAMCNETLTTCERVRDALEGR